MAEQKVGQVTIEVVPDLTRFIEVLERVSQMLQDLGITIDDAAVRLGDIADGG